MRESVLSAVALLISLWSISPAYAEAQVDADVVSQSMVRVRAYDGNEISVEGGGFVVSEMGHVLTNAHLLAEAERVTISPLKTGVEVVPEQLFANRRINLALLHAPSLNLPPIRLSDRGIDVGQAVRTLRFDVMGSLWLSQGTIGAYETIFDRQSGRPVGRLVQHNALITEKAFGMPLLNECGEVVAINVPNPRSGPWPFRTSRPKGVVLALSSKSMIAALDDREIAYKVVNAECLSALERAERDRLAAVDSLDGLRAEADSARRAAKEAEEKEGEARREAERAKARAAAEKKAAAASVQAAQARAESLNSVAARAARMDSADATATIIPDTAQADSDSVASSASARREEAGWEIPLGLKWGIPIGGAVVLLALLGRLLAANRRKEQLRSAESRLRAAEQTAEAVRQAAEAAPKPAPFRCLLEGEDSSGRPFALTVSALALSDPAGVTVGRSPAVADFVVDHEGVSRQHVRLGCTGAALWAEDLKSLNGTKLNGRLLDPEERAALQDGDQLETGPVAFSVRLVQE